ncbi:MAG: helix-turn-helix transcriptional regulator, partial [Eubacteriales bacterium]|nr:helix-turn-helix transcriptional regulator [Eubacteriales bacterium]
MDKVTSRKIGDRISCTLISKDMMQKELAEILSVTPNTISYFAKGDRTPNIEQIIKISKNLNVSADYILGLSDVPTRNETIQGINEKTGLSGETIARLQTEKATGNTAFAEFFDYIIKNP